MSPNNGTLLNAVLKPKVPNNTFASCFFMNLNFLLLDTAHFDDNIGRPFLVFNTFKFILFVFFSTVNNKSACCII